jgi:hypothetical protein
MTYLAPNPGKVLASDMEAKDTNAPTVSLVSKDVLNECRVPDSLFDGGTVFACSLADIGRLPGCIKHVRQMRELHAQHSICRRQER